MSNVVIAVENEDETVWFNQVAYDAVDFIGGGVFVSGDGIPNYHEGDAVAEQHYDGDWIVADWFFEINGITGKPRFWRRLFVVAAPTVFVVDVPTEE